MRVLYWVLLNGLIVTCIYLWLWEQIIWAENISKFLLILNTIIATLALIPEAAEKIKTKGRTVNPYIDNILDMIIVVSLVAFGHYWYGGFYWWHTVCVNHIHDDLQQ